MTFVSGVTFMLNTDGPSTSERQSAEPADNRHIKSQIIPPAGIHNFIHANIVHEDADDQ